MARGTGCVTTETAKPRSTASINDRQLDDLHRRSHLAAALAAAEHAEESGLPELDAVLTDYVAETWAPPIESLGGRRFPVADLRRPDRSSGRCKDSSRQFAAFARSHGLDAQPQRFATAEIGYPASAYGDHWLTVIYDPDGQPQASVDWTASQFGLTQFPLVERL